MTVYLTPARVLATHSLTTTGSQFTASAPKMKAWSKYEPWATEPAGDIKCNANRSNWERIPMPPGNLVLLWDYTLHVWNLSGTLTLKCTKHHVCVKVGPKVTKVFYTQQVFITLRVFFWNCCRKYLKKQFENILEELCKRIA